MAKQQLIKEAFKLQQIAGIRPLYEFESRLVREGLGSSTHQGKKINWNDYEVEEKGIDGGATDSVTLTGIDDEGNKYDAMGEMVHGELDPDTITDIQLLGGIQEGMDNGDELVDILLGHVKDPDQAEKYASMDPEMWPEWLEASLNRDPKYTEFAMDKIQEADDDDDAEDMEDDWNKADSDDDYEQEPTKKDIQVGDKMVGVLGGSQSRLQTLMSQKDAILSKFKSGEISIDQYKQEIGNIPQQIKNLQAAIEKQMSGGEEGEDEMLNESEIHYFYKTDRYGSRVCHAKDDEGNVWKVDDSKCRRVGTYNNQRDEVKKVSKGTNEGIFSGIKKALNYDTTYISIQDAFNNVTDAMTKKYKNLKTVDGGLTNGFKTIPVKLSDLKRSDKTIKLNGETVPMDDLVKAVDKLVKPSGVKKESVLGKYIRQEVVRTLKENEGVEGKQKHNYPKDRFKDDEEYEKFLDDTLKKLMDKITNDPKLLNVFKRLKDK
jgi:hypothetical protein